MSNSMLYGYRVGIGNRDYRGGNREILKRQKQIKKTVEIIRAEKCIRTSGEVFTEDYKKARKHMSDKTILERYNEIKEDMGLTLVARHGGE